MENESIKKLSNTLSNEISEDSKRLSTLDK